MKLTVSQFEKLGACEEGIAWLKTQKDMNLVPLVEAAIADGIDTARFANWGIVRLMDKRQRVRYAIYAAKQVLKIFEDKYPDDKRPREAIEAAEAYLKEPSEKNKLMARTAAYAAYADAAAYAAADAAAYTAAAADAAAAAYAAYTAAYTAADAAAYTSAYAADAAYADAAYAAYAVSNMRMLAKILRYGVKLVMEGEMTKQELVMEDK